MCICLLTMLTLAAVTSGGVNVVLDKAEPVNMRLLVKEVMSIIYRQVRPTTRSIVLHNDNNDGSAHDLIISSLHAESTLSVCILNMDTLWHEDHSTHNAFIILSASGDVKVFMDHLERVTKLPIWNTRSQVIFIDADVTKIHGDIAYQLLKTSWMKFETLFASAVSFSGNCLKSDKCVVARRFNPFVSEGETIDVTHSKALDDKSLPDAMGYPLTFPNFNYYPFSCVMIGENGRNQLGCISGRIMNNVCRVHNLSVAIGEDINTSFSNCVLPNNFYERIDIIYLSTLLQLSNLKTTVYPYKIENLVLIVPKAQKMPKWMSAILPFSYIVWILYLLCYLFLIAIGKVYKHFGVIQVGNMFGGLEMFRLFFLGLSQHEITSTWSRMYMISVMLFNLVFNNAYSGSFTSYLTVPQYYPDINTIEDFIKNKMIAGIATQYGSNMALDLSDMVTQMSNGDEILQTLISDITIIDTVDNGLHTVIAYRNLGVLYFLLGAQYEISKSEYFEGSRPMLHIVEQGVFSLYFVTEYRKNFPFMEMFNHYMWLFRESGIADKYLRDVFDRVLLDSQTMDNITMPLNTDHMLFYFYFLVFGHLFSIIIFVTEFRC